MDNRVHLPYKIVLFDGVNQMTGGVKKDSDSAGNEFYAEFERSCRERT